MSDTTITASIARKIFAQIEGVPWENDWRSNEILMTTDILIPFLTLFNYSV